MPNEMALGNAYAFIHNQKAVEQVEHKLATAERLAEAIEQAIIYLDPGAARSGEMDAHDNLQAALDAYREANK